MTSRSVYCFILRLHPSGFRSKYEDQMLWIFDESVRSRGAAPLLFDAIVSLIRQWLLRSANWRHSQPMTPIDDTTALTESLRRNAEALHRRAWRLNLLWMAGAISVMPLSRLQIFSGWFMFVIGINAIATYRRSKQGQRQGATANDKINLSSSRVPEDFWKVHKQRSEEKRDGLVEWCRFQPSKILWNSRWYFGGKLLLLLLVYAGVGVFLRPLRPGTSFDWLALLEFFSGLAVLAVSWRFVRKANDRAVQAIQQEIDAVDERSKPQSV